MFKKIKIKISIILRCKIPFDLPQFNCYVKKIPFTSTVVKLSENATKIMKILRKITRKKRKYLKQILFPSFHNIEKKNNFFEC